MSAAAQIGLLVAALALLLGCIYAAWQNDWQSAVVYGALAGTCVVFAMIIQAHKE